MRRFWTTALAVPLAVLMFLCIALASELRSSREPLRAAPPIEYRVLRWEKDLFNDKNRTEFNDELNAEGKNGWELIQAHGGILIFKRPK